jgi:hypothetical protein
VQGRILDWTVRSTTPGEVDTMPGTNPNIDEPNEDVEAHSASGRPDADNPLLPDEDDVEGHARRVVLEGPDRRGGRSSAVQFDREKLAGG